MQLYKDLKHYITISVSATDLKTTLEYSIRPHMSLHI